MSAETQKKLPRPTRFVLYAFRTATKGFVFYDVHDGGVRAKEPRVYEKLKKTGAPLIPGGVYSVEYNEEESQGGRLVIYPGTLQWVKAWSDKTEVKEWEARDRTVLAATEQERLERKARAESSALDQLLGDLRSVYRSVPFNQKPAFIALVVKTMTQGREGA